MLPSVRRLLLPVLLSPLALTACGGWRLGSSGPERAPSGLSWGEESMRRALVTGGAAQAYTLAAEGGRGVPDDALLRALLRGQTAYHAGRSDDAIRAFDVAIAETESRVTRSATREALGGLVSERARRYTPTRTERLFTHHYAMLARLQAGDLDGATVEARRLSSMLAIMADDVDAGERATHAALRESAAAVFEAAGEWNDASVALRNAAWLRGADAARLDSIVVVAPPADSARVLVILERGFASHYVERDLLLPLDPAWNTWYAGDEPRDRSRGRRTPGRDAWPVSGGIPRLVTDVSVGAVNDRTEVRPRLGDTKDDGKAASIPAAAEDLRPTSAVADSAVDAMRHSSLAWMDSLDGDGVEATDVEFAEADIGSVANAWTPRRRPGSWRVAPWWRTDGRRATAASGWLRVSWPVLVRPRLPQAAVTLVASAGEAPAARTGAGNVSDAIAADAKRARAGRLARLVTRNAARAALSRAVEEKHGEFAGFLVGLLAAGFDGADTRQWTLLPGELTVLRLTVPAGDSTVALRLGEALGGLTEPLVDRPLRAGERRVVSHRIWRDPLGVSPAITPTVAAADGRCAGRADGC